MRSKKKKKKDLDLTSISEKVNIRYTFDEKKSEHPFLIFSHFLRLCEKMYQISKNSVDTFRTQENMSLAQYKSNFAVQCVRFCLPDSDYGRMIAGLDTRQTACTISVTTQGLDSGGVRLDAFMECHSTLRIGAGRAIEVIV